MSTASIKQKPFKVYELVPSEIVHNSPFSIEASNGKKIVLDIPRMRNAPWKTTAIINGKEQEIRYVQGCDTIIVDEQVEKKYPRDRKPTPAERKKLDIINGQLFADSDILIKYLDSIPQNADVPEANRPPGTKVIFRELNDGKKNAAEYQRRVSQAKANAYITELSLEEAKNLLRLRYHSFVDENMSEEVAKIQLYDMVENEEGAVDFIEAHKALSVEDEVIILASKAMEADILSFHAVQGKAAIKTKRKWEPVTISTEEGGITAQFNRFVEYLRTEEGVQHQTTLKNILSNKEK